jgi:DNA-binding NarL/FixJ family response regulator
MEAGQNQTCNILIVDDEKSVHQTINEVLSPDEERASSKKSMKELAGRLFDVPEEVASAENKYELTFCLQGEEAVEAVERSIEGGRQYSVVFLDMRMPPGKDGLWTAEKIRELDPMVNILIMTAYSDIDPVEISAKVQPVDKLLYAQKPLRPQEIRQFAAALSSKWQSESQLVNTNLQLAAARNRLEGLLHERTEKLQNVEERLEERSTELAESGVAMKVLLKNISIDNFDMDEKVRELDERIVLNVKELTEPFLERLVGSDLNDEQRECLTILRSNLDKVTSPAMQRLYSDDHDLTPSELQVANLIRQGRKTKEIASLLNLSTRTIEFHRDNIRKKLGIRDRKTSLKSILKSI